MKVVDLVDLKRRKKKCEEDEGKGTDLLEVVLILGVFCL